MRRFEERMKVKLERKLVGVNRLIAALRHESLEEVDTSGDNTPLSDEADVSQVGEEQESRFELMERLIETAVNLEEALYQISKGTYGLCSHCERIIHR